MSKLDIEQAGMLIAEITSTYSFVVFLVFLATLASWYVQVAVKAARTGQNVWSAVRRAVLSWQTAAGVGFATTSLIRAFAS